jgi:microcystin-dependent protein
MRFHGIEMVGKFVLERVQSLPAWRDGDEGRVLYERDRERLFIGRQGSWFELGAGQGFNPIIVNSSQSPYAVGTSNALLLVDTTNGPVTLFLPDTPFPGEEIKVVDVAGTFQSNPCTIRRGAGQSFLNSPGQDLVCDVNNITLTLTYDGVSNWMVTLGGAVTIVGRVTLFVNKHVATATANQRVFTLPFDYNPAQDNISVSIQGVQQYNFEKTNENTVTLPVGVPAGTQVQFVSVPLEGGIDLSRFVTLDSVTTDFILGRLTGAPLDAQTLQGLTPGHFLQATDFRSAAYLDVGSEGGQIPVLGTGGKLAVAMIPTGTAQNTVPLIGAGDLLPSSIVPHHPPVSLGGTVLLGDHTAHGVFYEKPSSPWPIDAPTNTAVRWVTYRDSNNNWPTQVAFDAYGQRMWVRTRESSGGPWRPWVELQRAAPGMVAPFAMNAAPTGWLKCNGAAVSRTTYADLFSAIGVTWGAGNGSSTFNVPDLRGEFVRGWDDGRGIDSGRSFASQQLDALQNITGTFGPVKAGSLASNPTHNTTASGAFTVGDWEAQQGDGGNRSGVHIHFNASRVVRTAGETRPRNRALLYCIKF